MSVFFLVIGNSYISQKRRVAIFRLQKNIEEFELYLLRNTDVKESNIFKLLKSIKFVANNPEFLDIQILLMSKVVAEDKGNLSKDAKWFGKAVEYLPEELKVIYVDFDNNSDLIIRLSPYKLDFVLFALKIIGMSVVKNGVHAISKIIKEYKFILKNDEAIIYSGRLAAA